MKSQKGIAYMVRIDEIGRWSQTKLDMLRQYLAAYTSILKAEKNRSWCKGCHYVDAFSGGVFHLDKESYELVEGSPLLALKNSPPFDSFTFIDRDEQRMEECIQPLRESYPGANITTLTGDCNDLLANKVLPLFRGRQSPHRGFIFLDPYGINLAWNTVQAIAEAGIYDVLINFSVMGVYRQLGNKRPTDANMQKINTLMGSEEWFSLVYKPSRQCTLFPSSEAIMVRQGDHLVERLIEFYRSRLRSCFAKVSRSVIMRNSTGGALYALVLASHTELAVRKMHEIFDRAERKGKIS
jgi:three-Cys-motif partner protein